MTDDHSRVIDLSISVPGTPEQVWEAIATGPGISSWFVPHTVEERAGGHVTMDFGPGFGEFPATVTAWEPPRRIVFESPDPEGNPGLAFEWLVEAASGDTCVVRLVNSGFGSGAEWDGEFDGMSDGWPLFLENLRLYLTHFPGQPGRAVVPTVLTAGSIDVAWPNLCRAMGMPENPAPGDHLATTGDTLPGLVGTIESVVTTPRVRAVFARLDQPSPGTAFLTVERGGEDSSAASTYLYLRGDGPSAADVVERLRAALPPPA